MEFTKQRGVGLRVLGDVGRRDVPSGQPDVPGRKLIVAVCHRDYFVFPLLRDYFVFPLLVLSPGLTPVFPGAACFFFLLFFFFCLFHVPGGESAF